MSPEKFKVTGGTRKQVKMKLKDYMGYEITIAPDIIENEKKRIEYNIELEKLGKERRKTFIIKQFIHNYVINVVDLRKLEKRGVTIADLIAYCEKLNPSPNSPLESQHKPD